MSTMECQESTYGNASDEEPPGCPKSTTMLDTSAIPNHGDLPALAPTSLLAHLQRCRTGLVTRQFRRTFFAGVRDTQWNDWRWQMAHRIRTKESLGRLLRLAPDETAALEAPGRLLPISVTPYYMSLLGRDDPQHPLRRCVVPTVGEFERGHGEADDPLGEDSDCPTPGLVHRYPDRVLFLVTNQCSTYCRYCTRSRVVGQRGTEPSIAQWTRCLDYVRGTPSIRDVLLSGGDPLLLADYAIDWLLTQLRRIPHVEMVRIGTKVPAVLPQRITTALCRVLRRHHPLWLSLHFTHPDECTPESFRACRRLADSGIPLGSQTVLLRDINDDVATMRTLMQRLLLMRVRPYYLYQCDPISGSAHFRTPVQKGLEIIGGLRGHTTGYACPTFVIDAPGGGGKIPLLPRNAFGQDGPSLLLRNYEGKVYRYPDRCGLSDDATQAYDTPSR